MGSYPFNGKLYPDLKGVNFLNCKIVKLQLKVAKNKNKSKKGNYETGGEKSLYVHSNIFIIAFFTCSTSLIF